MDNLIYYSKYETDIHDLDIELCEAGVDFEQEDYAPGLLGAVFNI